MKKLLDQFDIGIESNHEKEAPPISEEKATLLFILNTLNKHLFEVENHSIRKTRESLDLIAKELMNCSQEKVEDVLFRFRQFYSKYRIDECSYFEKTFEDFKTIVWDFVDQLSEDIAFDQKNDKKLNQKLLLLKEAVEANSIDELKNQSREFIDSYVEYQSKKENRNKKKMAFIENNLTNVKQKLVQANMNMRRDHLTKAYNRKSFDEHVKQLHKLNRSNNKAITLIILDIDFFKKINDNYGHDIGDFVLVECVKLLQNIFSRESDFVARIGGEEFAILLPDYRLEHAADKAQKALQIIRNEVFVQDGHQLRFTVSMGIAQLGESESIDQWIKRADQALYESKNTGRNKFTLSKCAKAHMKSVS